MQNYILIKSIASNDGVYQCVINFIYDLCQKKRI